MGAYEKAVWRIDKSIYATRHCTNMTGGVVEVVKDQPGKGKMEKKRPDIKYKTDKRGLRALAGSVMRLPCNRKNADKLCVYESQRVYAAYFREVCK